MSKEQATPEDRLHFCSYDEAYMAIPDELPFKSNGHRHVATNLSTGHQIPCADAYIATGYVAGSTIKFPQWRFALVMGNDKVFDIKAHPNFNKRLHDDSWAQNEATQRQNESRICAS